MLFFSDTYFIVTVMYLSFCYVCQCHCNSYTVTVAANAFIVLIFFCILIFDQKVTIVQLNRQRTKLIMKPDVLLHSLQLCGFWLIIFREFMLKYVQNTK